MKSSYYSHRGFFDNKLIYENTLEAFKISVEKGYGIELDVRSTLDNQLIIFHDDNLKRMFNIDVKVQSLTLKSLYNLGLKYHNPTLQEVLDLIQGKVDLIIEFKHGKNDDVLCKLAYETLLSYGGTFSVESFHPKIVYWFKKNAPEIDRGQLLMSISEYDYFALGLFMISHVTSLLTKPHFYAYRKELGKSKLARRLLNSGSAYIVVWTMEENDPLYLNASKIIFENCDNPEILWPINRNFKL